MATKMGTTARTRTATRWEALAFREARLLAAGFVGYLTKPISVREFPDQVRRFCEGA